MIRKAVCAIIVLSVLAFQSVSQAETPEVKKEGQPVTAGAVVKSANESTESVDTTQVVDPKELNCLARNIFFEARGEPYEGKVAVGIVTLNRVQDERWPNSVCDVVNQKTTRTVPRDVIVETKSMFRTVRKLSTIEVKTTVCQFSWRCMHVKTPKSTDELWIDALRIARNLLAGNYIYEDIQQKYHRAFYFHATYVKPVWAKQKEYVGRVGGHHFYGDTKIAYVLTGR
jgi:spore germination cell wall hydrolase CwlJ-like protein